MWNWLWGGVGSAAEKIGLAVNRNYRTMRGDRAEERAASHTETMATLSQIAEKEQNINSEQLAVLAQYAAEFASRPPKSKWDSFVDGLNRLPRPLITMSVMGSFLYCLYDPIGFARYMMAMELVPEELWTLFIGIISFWFGSRIISQDIRKPKLTEAQRERALTAIKEKEQAITESRPVLVVERPTRKPPQPRSKPPQLQATTPEHDTTPTPECPPTEPPPAPTPTSDPIKPMLDALIKREGGYVNHPADRGGATKYGITRATLATWRGKPVTVNDVKLLARSEAEEIYRAFYYHGPKIDKLPSAIQAHVMDIGVNAGPRTSVKMLQSVLNSFGEQLKLDGVVGPLTWGACERYDPVTIHNAIVAARMKFYNAICAAKPSQKVFLAGWEKRANEFRVG